MAITPIERHNEAADRAILEAELRQLQEFLTEALADSARLTREKAELSMRLSATRQSEAEAQKKLAYIQSHAPNEDQADVVASLRAELAQTSEVLGRARRTLHDLAMFSAGASGLGQDSKFFLGSDALRLIDATIDSIEVTLVRTSG